MGYLAQDLMGQGIVSVNTLIYGAGVTPGTGLVVNVAPGRIYQEAPIDATAWSSLPINDSVIMQQGIALNATVFPVPAPITVGDSINYLIQAQFAQTDTNFATLSYYNSLNPTQPFSGAGNNGIAQPKTRAGQMALQILAGSPATTGTQVTPTTTSGWVPLAIITIAYGAASVTTGNISIPLAAPYAAGSFNMGSAGLASGTTNGTCYYSINGPIVTLTLPVITGVSNVDTFTLTGLPYTIVPDNALLGSNNQLCPIALAQDNSAYVAGAYASIVGASNVISLALLGSLTGWTASGTKSVAGNIQYRIF